MSRRRAARRAVLQVLYRDEFYPEPLFEKGVEKFLLFLQEKDQRIRQEKDQNKDQSKKQDNKQGKNQSNKQGKDKDQGKDQNNNQNKDQSRKQGKDQSNKQGEKQAQHLNEIDNSFALYMLSGIKDKKAEIDETIKRGVRNWSLDRISLVDLNILRMGVFEICFSDKAPAVAALNEALELAKEFGEENSASFINGILDQVLKTAGKKDVKNI